MMNPSELKLEQQYWHHVTLFHHVNTLHANSLHEAADDLRYLITSSRSCHKDIFHADKLVERTIYPSTTIPFSHEKLATMLDLVDGIKCNIPSDLLISSLNYILASAMLNWVSSSNVFIMGMIYVLLFIGCFY